jgi:hypothetical protein
MKSIKLIILISSLTTSIQIIVSGFTFHHNNNQGRHGMNVPNKDVMKRISYHKMNSRSSNIIGMNNRWNSHNLIQMRHGQALNGSSNEGNDVDDDFSVSTTQLEINGSSTSSLSSDDNKFMEDENIRSESENNDNELPLSLDETTMNGTKDDQKEKEIRIQNDDADIDNFEQTDKSYIDKDNQEGERDETISNHPLDSLKSSFFDNNQINSDEFQSPLNKYVGDLTVSLYIIYRRWDNY